MNAQRPVRTIALIALVSCATAAQAASRPKTISYDEASAYERALLAQPASSPTRPQKLYVQPANKSEPCKLPSTPDQTSRPNFRAFWDGECKNGFAYGIGRDIAISDTHHVEEITIHDGTGNDEAEPRADYDFVNQRVSYSTGSPFTSGTQLIQEISDSIDGFDVRETYRVVDGSGNEFFFQSSPFSPDRLYVATKANGSVGYRFLDRSAAPVTDPTAPVFRVDIVDPRTKTTGGVAIAKYANGSVRHFKVSNGQAQLTTLPTAYTQHLQSEYTEITTAMSRVTSELQPAQQIEREYLYKTCNGKSGVRGLDVDTYKKICTWRDQFKAPYAAASAKYQRELQSLQERAATVAQQQSIQQQLALQQQMLRQQQSQQSWSSLSQAAGQLQQSTQQIMQTVNSWQAPQVEPIRPPGGNTVVCESIGIITTCR
jgi:hypothetical protein